MATMQCFMPFIQIVTPAGVSRFGVPIYWARTGVLGFIPTATTPWRSSSGWFLVVLVGGVGFENSGMYWHYYYLPNQ